MAPFALFITHRGTCSLYKDIEFFLYESIFTPLPERLPGLQTVFMVQQKASD